MDENLQIKPFEESIFSSELKDFSTDISEMSLDWVTSSVFQGVSDFLIDLPVVKGVIALGKTAWNIKKAVTLRNQLAYIQELQNGVYDQKRIEKRKNALENHEKWIEKEIELTVIYLDRYTNAKKAVFQAKMYGDVINEKIKFKDYEDYLAILDQLLIGDIEYFNIVFDYYNENKMDFENEDFVDTIEFHYDATRCRRLEFLGLLSGLITTRVGMSTVDRYKPTSIGEYFYSIFNKTV